jgi:hypothetical protein
MTLLIGTTSDKHAFLTSDRRCIVEEQGVVSESDVFQKIFPAPGEPLAVVHHGENVFLDESGSETSLSAFLAAFMRDEADVFQQPSIEAIASRLADQVDAVSRRALQSRGKNVIGFWVAGFAKGSAKPEIYEVCWCKDRRREFKNCGSLVVGGEGQEHLPPNVRDYLDGTYNLNSIPGSPAERIRRYHNKLFGIALQKERQPRRFSEGRDQLLITADGGCEWVIPPATQGSKQGHRQPPGMPPKNC